MKRIILVALGLILLGTFAFGMPGTANWKLVWDANTESDLAGYKVYWSLTSGDYSDSNFRDVGNVTEQFLSGLPLTEGNTYYFVLTAYDISDNESDFSKEVSHFFDQAAPDAPVNVRKELVIEF